MTLSIYKNNWLNLVHTPTVASTIQVVINKMTPKAVVIWDM